MLASCVTCTPAAGDASLCLHACFCQPVRVADTYASAGLGGFNGDELAPDDILLSFPRGIAVDPASNLFIMDTENQRLLVHNRQPSAITVAGVNVPAGIVKRVAGTGEDGFNGDALPAPFTALSIPADVIVDPSGNIYVSDTGNRRVRRFAR